MPYAVCPYSIVFLHVCKYSTGPVNASLRRQRRTTDLLYNLHCNAIWTSAPGQSAEDWELPEASTPCRASCSCAHLIHRHRDTDSRQTHKQTHRQTNTKAYTETETYIWTSTECRASCSCAHLIHKHMCTGTHKDKYIDTNTKSCTIFTPSRSRCCISLFISLYYLWGN